MNSPTQPDPLDEPGAAEHFWSKVDKSGECWIWTGDTSTKGGYGRWRIRGTSERAHRLAYRLAVGEIPDGLMVLHSCDNPPCVNPDHLRVGTQSENCLDRSERKRGWPERRTHCAQGHPFSGDNLHIRSDGARICLTCYRERQRKRVRK